MEAAQARRAIRGPISGRGRLTRLAQAGARAEAARAGGAVKIVPAAAKRRGAKRATEAAGRR